MPYINPELVIEAIKTVVKVDEDWIPTLAGTSLYIRPFIIATEAFLGVRPAKEYKFIIIMSPVGAYYKGGLMPTKIFVEDEYVRAVPGGTGEAKIGGNYIQIRTFALPDSDLLVFCFSPTLRYSST